MNPSEEDRALGLTGPVRVWADLTHFKEHGKARGLKAEDHSYPAHAVPLKTLVAQPQKYVPGLKMPASITVHASSSRAPTLSKLKARQGTCERLYAGQLKLCKLIRIRSCTDTRLLSLSTA